MFCEKKILEQECVFCHSRMMRIRYNKIKKRRLRRFEECFAFFPIQDAVSYKIKKGLPHLMRQSFKYFIRLLRLRSKSRFRQMQEM